MRMYVNHKMMSMMCKLGEWEEVMQILNVMHILEVMCNPDVCNQDALHSIKGQGINSKDTFDLESL
jgi:pentatricopeptide repeat protein